MKGLIATITSLLGFSSLVSAQTNPMACSGTCTNTHDPSLIRRSDGTYFRFSTNGEIAMHTAPAIGGPWTYRGPAIPGGSSINLPGRTDLWAPDVNLIGGTYYLYYAVSTFGSQTSSIGYATSTDLLSWTDHGALGVASSPGKAYNAIDPNLAVDGSRLFMTFGSFWNDIYQVPLSSPTSVSGTATQKAFNATGSHSEEGAFLYKNGAFWYLFFSSGQCCGLDASRPRAGDEYKIMVCRGSAVTGPFTDKNGRACTSSGGTLVLGSHGNVYAPGGQGVFNDPSLGPVLYYHYVNIPNGFSDGAKLFGVNRLNFASGWPVV